MSEMTFDQVSDYLLESELQHERLDLPGGRLSEIRRYPDHNLMVVLAVNGRAYLYACPPEVWDDLQTQEPEELDRSWWSWARKQEAIRLTEVPDIPMPEAGG